MRGGYRVGLMRWKNRGWLSRKEWRNQRWEGALGGMGIMCVNHKDVPHRKALCIARSTKKFMGACLVARGGTIFTFEDLNNEIKSRWNMCSFQLGL